MIKNSKVYDFLKYLAQIVLPALATLYFALAGIWGLPAADQVVGTIVAVDTFLGVVLQLSKSAYVKDDANFDGKMNVHQVDGKTVFQLEFKDDEQLDPLNEKKVVQFKVHQVGE